jgi:hypothetical protein
MQHQEIKEVCCITEAGYIVKVVSSISRALDYIHKNQDKHKYKLAWKIFKLDSEEC